MESAPARAQSRIPPFRLSKTVQPAPHKGQRRWLPHFSGQSSSADAKNGVKKRVFPKCLLSPRGTRAAGHSVSTHTMLRAALKPFSFCNMRIAASGLDTHNAACGIETTAASLRPLIAPEVSTHTMLRAALKPNRSAEANRTNMVSTHTMLRAALKHRRHDENYSRLWRLDTHNAACGIETPIFFHRAPANGRLDTHNAACGIETSHNQR